MAPPKNEDWLAFTILGAFAGLIAGGLIGAAIAWERGFVAGERQGQCDEECQPLQLVAVLQDGACRCDHDDIVRPKSKPAKEPLR